MFLKCRTRRKDGKVHRSWSMVESRRCAGNKVVLFAHLRGRWADLFGARYEVLLYDLTSTYFECDAPDDPADPRRFGYSRDRRGDCAQVIVAVVVAPEGLPLAYEMMPGNTADSATLRDMLALVQKRHGQAERVWVMDRGIPTEETLAEMRASRLRAIWLALRRGASPGWKRP